MGAIIKTIAAFLPDTILTNEQLVANKRVPYSAEDILRKTGVASRHVAADDESTVDLAYEACMKLFSSGVVDKADVDWLIFCTQTPDYVIPSSACILQNRLGLSKTTGCFDINLACTGFIYSLLMVDSLISSGKARNVVLVNADTYTKFIRNDDFSMSTLFGDGATATLCQNGLPNEGVLSHKVGTDGSGYDKLIRRYGGSRYPGGIPMEKGDYISMDGPEIFRFVQKVVSADIKSFLSSNNLQPGNVDYFMLHQASGYMLENLGRRLGLKNEQLPIEMRDTGNTVSASIPLAISNLACRGPRDFDGKLAVFSGFGAGLSYGSILYRFPASGIIAIL